MNPQFESDLVARGARFAGLRIETFGPRHSEFPAPDASHVVPLTQWALLRASGADALTFLQNLLTNDVRKLGPDTAQLNGFCTPKGRLLASFLVWREGDDYLLALSADIAPAIEKKLKMYVLRSKVTLTSESQDRAIFGLTGPAATPFLAARSLLPAATSYAVARADGLVALQLPENRFVLLAPAGQAAGLLDALTAAGFQPGATNVWACGDIAAGLPLITERTQEEFVPQMVNFDLIGAVSFQKGCYPGQEIVARTKYLGKLKKRMYRARIEGAAPACGDALFGVDLADQSCGEVVTVGQLADGSHEVLAVMQTSSADAGPVRLGRADGPVLKLLPLPYEFA